MDPDDLMHSLDNIPSFGEYVEQQKNEPKTHNPPQQSQPDNQNLPKLVEVMKKVDTSSPEAQLNKTSMDDGNGGRITFSDDPKRPNTLKGVNH